MDQCEICPIIATCNNGDDVLVLQSKYWRVVLDQDQRTLGKSFVTLLEHKQTLSELTEQEWIDFHHVVRQLESSVGRAFKPSHFNWQCLMNNAIVAKQPTHVHWHMHPRYAAPVQYAGETFVDSELILPKERTKHVVTRDVAEQIAHTMAL